MRRNRLQLENLHSGLVAAYSEVPDPASPAAIRYAAEKGGCSTQVARRAFSVGLGKGLRPISDLLSEEKLLARASLRKEDIANRVTQATELAREDAVASRVHAGKLVVQQQLALSALLEAWFGSQVQTLKERAARGEVKPVEFAGLANVLKSLISAARELQTEECLLLGSPTQILGGEIAVNPGAQMEISLDEARRDVEAANRALQELAEVNQSAENLGRAIARTGQDPQLH